MPQEGRPADDLGHTCQILCLRSIAPATAVSNTTIKQFEFTGLYLTQLLHRPHAGNAAIAGVDGAASATRSAHISSRRRIKSGTTSSLVAATTYACTADYINATTDPSVRRESSGHRGQATGDFTSKASQRRRFWITISSRPKVSKLNLWIR